MPRWNLCKLAVLALGVVIPALALAQQPPPPDGGPLPKDVLKSLPPPPTRINPIPAEDPFRAATPYNPTRVGREIPDPRLNRPNFTLDCEFENISPDTYVWPEGRWRNRWAERGCRSGKSFDGGCGDSCGTCDRHQSDCGQTCGHCEKCKSGFGGKLFDSCAGWNRWLRFGGSGCGGCGSCTRSCETTCTPCKPTCCTPCKPICCTPRKATCQTQRKPTCCTPSKPACEPSCKAGCVRPCGHEQGADENTGDYARRFVLQLCGYHKPSGYSYCNSGFGCSSFKSECTFIFGSCRQFYCEPTHRGQPRFAPPALPAPVATPAPGAVIVP